MWREGRGCFKWLLEMRAVEVGRKAQVLGLLRGKSHYQEERPRGCRAHDLRTKGIVWVAVCLASVGSHGQCQPAWARPSLSLLWGGCQESWFPHPEPLFMSSSGLLVGEVGSRASQSPSTSSMHHLDVLWKCCFPRLFRNTPPLFSLNNQEWVL